MSGQRLLITGASGFVGSQIISAHERGDLMPEMKIMSPPKRWDIRDPSRVEAFIADNRPDAVIHLAAQSFVPLSFDNPRETFEINLGGTLNLLEALKAVGFKGRMIFVSSGDVYGQVPEADLPVDETRIPEPRSPYAVSKIAAEQLCLQAHRSYELDVMVARPFNHVGPGQDERFVLPDLARQVVAIAQHQKAAVIRAGDIDTTRDFTDVRDVIRAYAALLARGKPGRTYVIGSGIERRIRDLLDLMCDIAGIAPDIQLDPTRARPSEQRRMAADAARIREDTGWVPTISIRKTLEDILDHARNNP